MTLARQSSPFSAIANAVLSRIASAINIGASFVTLVANDKYKLTEVEPINVRVQVFKPRPVNPGTGGGLVNQGAGRLALDVSRVFRVYIHTRSGTDISESDNAGLVGGTPTAVVTDTPDLSTGHFWYEEAVLNALHDFAPVAGGVCLTIGPIRWTDGNGEPERKATDGEGVMQSFLDFEAVYVASIVTTDPVVT